MKKYIIKFISIPLISGSILIFFGSQITNVLQVLFHIFLSSQLEKVSDYGNLATFTSIITLFALVSGSLTPTIVNFAGRYFEKKEYGSVYYLFKRFSLLTGGIGIFVCLITLVFAPVIAEYLQLGEVSYVILASLTISVNLLLVVSTGLLQARLKFGYIAISNFLGAFVKLIGSVVAILVGYGLFGVLGTLLLSSIVVYIINIFPLGDILLKKQTTVLIPTKDIIKYAIPASLATLFLTAYTSTDLILVKHFFSPFEAGKYAGLLLVGKVIFFFTYPIGMVMFPLITQRLAKQEKFHDVFFQALGLVLIPSVLLSILFSLFPSYILLFFLRKTEYLSMAPYLGYVAVFISLYAVITIITSFFLAAGKMHVWMILGIGALAQFCLVQLYHSTIYSVLFCSIGILVGVMLSLILYYLYSFHKVTLWTKK